MNLKPTIDRRIIRVFISSTFRDMEEERNLLMTQVWPQLRSYCRERYVEFVEVDLRWGITEEESNQKETLKICFDEINACRPYFIGLVGERYGWVPPAEAFNELLNEENDWLSSQREKSVTELEVIKGVLHQPEMAGHSFFYFRDPVYAHDRGADFLSVNADSEKKQAAFKDTIRKCCHKYHIPLREDYANPEELALVVLDDLKSVIEQQYPKEEVQDKLTREALDHEAFAESRRRTYIPRQSCYDMLDQHASSGDGPLIITGESGCGKSALLANWINHWRARHPKDYVFQHFIGATPDSTDYLKLISRLITEIKNWTKDPTEVPIRKEDLVKDLINWLSKARIKAARDKLCFVIVIDGINQLEEFENTPTLSWLPEFPFKDNLRLIVSNSSGESIEIVNKRSWKRLQLNLLSLDEKKMLIGAYLQHFSKKLDKKHLQRIVNTEITSNPLFLKILLDELRVTGSFEHINELIDNYLSKKDIPSLLQQVLYRYQLDYSKERKDLVKDCLSFIWSARDGLSEKELLELLKPEGTTKLSHAFFSPFRAVLEDQIISRNGIWIFANDYLMQAVEKAFLPTNKIITDYRIKLADYFESLPADGRVSFELPWLLEDSKLYGRLQNCLLNMDHFMILSEYHELELHSYWNKWKENKWITKKYMSSFEKWIVNKFNIYDIIICMNHLGCFYGNMGFYEEAEELNQMVVDEVESYFGNLHPQVAIAINNLAYFISLHDENRYLDDLYLRAIEIFEKCDEIDTQDYAKTLVNLGRSKFQSFDEKVSLLNRAIYVYINICGSDAPEVAHLKGILSGVFIRANRFLEAEKLITESINIYENKFGSNNSLVAEEFFRLGWIRVKLNKLENAEQLMSKSIEISKILTGNERSEIADKLYELSKVFIMQEKRNEAIKALEEAILICNKTHFTENTFVDLYRSELKKLTG